MTVNPNPELSDAPLGSVRGFWAWVVAVLAVSAIGCALAMLLDEQAGVERRAVVAGDSPATVYTLGEPGPVVVVAHGFSGSRQFMEGISLTLARSGYTVVSYDLLGHGRNPVPMSGDVTTVDGATLRFMDELTGVIELAKSLPEASEGLALVGHSMATDILVREALRRDDVDAIGAISMYSEAVTAEAPDRLLIVSGQWEPHLREVAVDALTSLDPNAREGQTVSGDLTRRVVVAPYVEHLGVLYSKTTLGEVRSWLDATFERTSTGPLVQRGPWVALLLAGILLLAWPASRLLPLNPNRATLPVPRWSTLGLAVGGPVLITPLLLWPLELQIIPVLVADYLALHLAVYGILQLSVLRALGYRPERILTGAGGPYWPAIALVGFGLGGFGLALDTFGGSFWPSGMRWGIIAVVALGAVLFMVAESLVTAGSRASLAKRAFVRGGFLVSLGIAVALDPEELFFLVLILPIILLFYGVFGTMARYVGRRSGPLSAGLGLGLLLAWAIGVSFPIYVG